MLFSPDLKVIPRKAGCGSAARLPRRRAATTRPTKSRVNRADELVAPKTIDKTVCLGEVFVQILVKVTMVFSTERGNADPGEHIDDFWMGYVSSRIIAHASESSNQCIHFFLQALNTISAFCQFPVI